MFGVPMDFDYELLFQYFGMAACVMATIYLFIRGQRTAALLLFAGFALQIQGILYNQLVGLPKGAGSCWITQQSFYDCLPLTHKLSIHASQIGTLLLALGIIVIGVRIKRV